MTNYRLGFVLEQTLGHVTHGRNLREWVEADARVAPRWMPVAFEQDDLWQRAPLVRANWTLRASLRARRQVVGALREAPLAALFYHTQVTALLAGPPMRRIPTVVSLDATPINVDTVGAAYQHAPSRSRSIERWKDRLNERTFRQARHLVTWCDWARRSLVSDYGIPPERVTVIPPGVDLGRWRFDRSSREPGPVRLLFVGGDFRRKGGEHLLAAFGALPAGRCTLDIATRETVNADGVEGVRVHYGLTANSPELRALFAAADIFVFPTLGDCLPIAVMEAMASGLPVIATCVGALDEEVADGETGALIAPGDTDALTGALTRMLDDPDACRRMGQAGRARAEAKFSAEQNYRAVIDLCLRCADGRL